MTICNHITQSILSPKIQDTQSIHEFKKKVINSSPSIFPANYINYSNSLSYDIFEWALLLNKSKLWITKDYKGRILGFISVKPISKNVLELTNIYICLSIQRSGYGKKLISKALKYATQHNFSTIQIHVPHSQVNIFKKLGFLLTDSFSYIYVGKIESYPIYLDCVLMKKTLTFQEN